MSPALIALDWGTSSLRAYLMASDGTIIEQRAGGRGIMQVEGGQFEAALNAICGDWRGAHTAAALITSGMIGSKQGWQEAPYCACPANATAIAAALININLNDGRPLHIVPGVSFIDPASDVPDVMRGEETQIIGAMPLTGTHLCVLPGTHSKWAWMRDGVIERFSSWITGEVYAALTQHTILGRLMQFDAPHDEVAFARGVEYGFAHPEALLTRIFSARTLGLFETLAAAALPSYLSGLLIGAEIGGAMAMEQIPGEKHENLGSGITLLGSHELTVRYALACRLAGLHVAIGPQDSAARGLYCIARAAGTLAEIK